jgi:phosphate-selective porin OprO/OprP
VAASYVVTGEQASYKGVNPKRPFDPRNGAWGAVEIATRYSDLSVDKDAFPSFADPAVSARKARAWAAGVNWYLNKGVKIVLDYEQTKFDGGAAGADREDERVILSRFQIAY